MSKISKFRWTAGAAAREDLTNIDPSTAIWDCGSMMAANEDYIAVPWAATGSTVVLKAGSTGKLQPGVAKLSGHAGPVLEVSFNPFHKDLLFTTGEDATIRAWRIPEGGLTSDMTTATAVLSGGHSKKVGILSWHPSAENVLASVGMDHVINVWDVTNGAPKLSFKQQEQQTSLNWNIDGTLLNTTSKDKHVYIFDSRTGAVAAKTPSHAGSKAQRSVWAKRRELIITVGFNKQQYRQLMVWDPRSMEKPLHTHEIDQNSAIMMPFLDEDTNLLYVAGKGDNDITYFDLWRETTPIVPVNRFVAPEQIRALCMAPKSCMRLKDCELSRFYAVSNKTMRTISFCLPRRQGATQFQADIYPSTFATTPALSADDFFAGKSAAPKETDFSATFDGGVAVTQDSSVAASSSAPASPPAAASPAPPAPVAATPAAEPAAVAPVEALEPVAEAKPVEEAKPEPTPEEKATPEEKPAPEAKATPTPTLEEKILAQKAKIEDLKQQLEREMAVLSELEGAEKAE